MNRFALLCGDLLFGGLDAAMSMIARHAGWSVSRTPVSTYCREIVNEITSEVANDIYSWFTGTVDLARTYPDYAAFAAGVALLYFGGMTPAEWAYQIARSAFLTQMARRAPWWARPIFSAAGYG
jgi:hypothetical protein